MGGRGRVPAVRTQTAEHKVVRLKRAPCYYCYANPFNRETSRHWDVFRTPRIYRSARSLPAWLRALRTTDLRDGGRPSSPAGHKRALGRRCAHPAGRAAQAAPPLASRSLGCSCRSELEQLPRVGRARPCSSPGDSDADPTPREPQPPATAVPTLGEPPQSTLRYKQVNQQTRGPAPGAGGLQRASTVPPQQLRQLRSRNPQVTSQGAQPVRRAPRLRGGDTGGTRSPETASQAACPRPREGPSAGSRRPGARSGGARGRPGGGPRRAAEGGAGWGGRPTDGVGPGRGRRFRAWARGAGPGARTGARGVDAGLAGGHDLPPCPGPTAVPPGQTGCRRRGARAPCADRWGSAPASWHRCVRPPRRTLHRLSDRQPPKHRPSPLQKPRPARAADSARTQSPSAARSASQ